MPPWRGDRLVFDGSGGLSCRKSDGGNDYCVANDRSGWFSSLVYPGVFWVCWLFGDRQQSLIYGLSQVGVSLVPLLTGVGVGGLAVALAARPSIENIIGSFMIFADKPYRVGQRVKVMGQDGTVEAIGLRSTKIRLLNGHLTSIPNEKMATRGDRKHRPQALHPAHLQRHHHLRHAAGEDHPRGRDPAGDSGRARSAGSGTVRFHRGVGGHRWYRRVGGHRHTEDEQNPIPTRRSTSRTFRRASTSTTSTRTP